MGRNACKGALTRAIPSLGKIGRHTKNRDLLDEPIGATPAKQGPPDIQVVNLHSAVFCIVRFGSKAQKAMSTLPLKGDITDFMHTRPSLWCAGRCTVSRTRPHRCRF